MRRWAVIILLYALSFGPAMYLVTKTGLRRRASATAGAIFDFGFYPHYIIAENWPPYLKYIRWWESLASPSQARNLSVNFLGFTNIAQGAVAVFKITNGSAQSFCAIVSLEKFST